MCSENKGADQLCSYCTPDLRLCFRICKSLVFLLRGSLIISIMYFNQSQSMMNFTLIYLKFCKTLVAKFTRPVFLVMLTVI